MNKYTIIKSFEKDSIFPIWKIEVDAINNYIALETRNPENTLPNFSVFNFAGDDLLVDFQADKKEWTLDSIQGDHLIIKRFGSSSPIQAGIQIIHIPSASIRSTHLEYVLKVVYKDVIEATHRSIPSGLNFYIDLATSAVSTKVDVLEIQTSEVNIPVNYTGKIPSFIREINYIDQIWLQPLKQNLFLWSYHTDQTPHTKLNLILSSKNEILDHKIIFGGLNKLIPQPYFQVKDYIFFLADNKKKIATYLVLL